MREEVYDISGMHCAACSASVEKVTRRLPGVEPVSYTHLDVYKRQL